MIAILMATALLAQTASPAAISSEEQALIDGLAAARVLLDKKEWKKGEALVHQLIELNTKRPYMWLHLPEIRDDLESAGFWQQYKEVDAKQLISGELISYSKSGANLKVRYTPKTLSDFEEFSAKLESSAWQHPLVFSGPYTLEFRGKKYPSPDKVQILPVVWFCSDASQGQLVSFGLAQFDYDGKRYKADAKYKARHDGNWQDVSSKDPSPCQGGEAFDLRIKVDESTIAVSVDGRPLFSAKKSSDFYGSFGFAGLDEFDELIVQGRAEPSWIEGVLDARLQKSWNEFDARFKDSSAIPDWLKPEKLGTPRTQFNSDDLPSTPKASLEKTVREVYTAKLDDEKLKSLEGLECADDLKAWLAAIGNWRTRHWSTALAQCDKVLGLHGDFRPAHRMRAELLLRTHRYSDALTEVRQLSVAEPDARDLVAERAGLALGEGKFDEVAEVLRGEAEKGHYTDELDRVNSNLVRARNGPGWKNAFESKTAHYVVSSDIDKKTCIEVAELLENSLARFVARLRPLPKESVEPFHVFVFSGFDSYNRYVHEASEGSGEHTLGMYIPSLKQLMMWNASDHRGMLQTARHEGLHQYLDRWLDSPPTWLNEGLAMYYENADFKRGPSREILVNAARLEVLRRKGAKLFALRDLVSMDHETFMKSADICYAESWAFVHFLMSTTPERRKIVDAIFDAMLGGADADAAVESAFRGVDFELLNRDFQAHIGSLQD